jgi:hypothetical protein
MAHLGDRRDIPYGNIAIKRCCSIEHRPHESDRRDIPFRDIAIEGRHSERTVHSSDFRDMKNE